MDVKVNANQWNQISKDDQNRVTAIVSGYFRGATIKPDPAAPAADTKAATTMGGWNPFCKAACDVAEAAAVAACSALSGGVAIAACIAAAHVAGEACRNSC